MASLGKIVSHGFGAVAGFTTGLLSSPIFGAWYTYQTTKARGWNLPFVFSLATFLPRLLFNVSTFPFLSMAGGLVHGARAGFIAGLFWSSRFLDIINHPTQRLNLLFTIFSSPVLAPAAVPAVAGVPAVLAPVMAPVLAPVMAPVLAPVIAPVLAPAPIIPATPLLSTLLTPSLIMQFEGKEEKSEDSSDSESLVLNLNDVRLGIWTEQHFADLVIKLHLMKYDCLNLSHNDLEDLSPACITTLMETIKQSRIKELFLNYTNLGHWDADQVQALAKGLVSCEIRVLHISEANLDKLTPELFHILIDAITDSQVHTLYLSYNKLATFPPAVMLPILEKLKRSKVSSVFLDNNNLGEWAISVDEWIQFIANLNVKQLDLSQNLLQHAGRQWENKDIIHFAKTLAHMSKINLIGNNFSDTQVALFNEMNQIRPKMRAFFLGQSAKSPSDVKEEKKAEPTPVAAIYGRFFNHPLGQDAAHKLTKKIFVEFLGELTLDF